MKSTYFNRPLEFAIDIEGDEWSQGDSLKGSVKVKNHSDENFDLSSYGIFLCKGNAKKIKLADPKGLEVVSHLLFTNYENNQFDFELDQNCLITEKSTGMYLVCAPKDDLLSGQHLILQVRPSQKFSKIVEILENFLRFQTKSIKSKKDTLEYTLNIPANKEYSSISSFKLSMSLSANDLQLNYQFKIKKLVYENSMTTTKDEVKKFDFTLLPSQYLIYGESIDQDKLLTHFNSVLDEVKLRPVV
ncbi:hypothetical protein [Halobacteriovorax sp. HLS]|uniref:hypothetical protein n=1 Tax=Halobacteriovorax sp. HLS TaxID=2234000 RepID=UPI000FDB13D4|nr:hypothetical protein [Halobacteriovorax sp. HLS]